MTQHLIEGVGDVIEADMTVPCPTEIPGLNSVPRNITHRRRPDKKRILVEVSAGLGVVIVNAELSRVAFPLGVLPENVKDEYSLIPEIELADASIQFAIGVLLKQVEVSCVEVVAVARELSKQPRAKIKIIENEATKIAVELLYTSPQKCRVVERALSILASLSAQERQPLCRMAQFHFAEQLLKPDLAVRSARLPANVDVDYSIFLGVQIVDVEVGRKPKPPVDRLEHRVAIEELDREGEILTEELVGSAPKELGAVGPRAGDVAWKRQPSRDEQSVAFKVEHQEILLFEDRIVALENILPIRVVPLPTFKPWIVRWKTNPLAIRSRHKVGRCLSGSFY